MLPRRQFSGGSEAHRRSSHLADQFRHVSALGGRCADRLAESPRAADRLEATFATVGTRRRFRGHFFNWYDTHDLRPLEPKYVSSVDRQSGGASDRAGQCLPEAIDPAIASGHWIAGVEDALAPGARRFAPGPAQASIRKRLEAEFATIDALWPRRRGLLRMLPASWRRAGPAHQAIARSPSRDIRPGEGGASSTTLIWLRALRRSVGSHQRDLDELMPPARASGDGTPGGRGRRPGSARSPTTFRRPPGPGNRLLALAEWPRRSRRRWNSAFFSTPPASCSRSRFQVGEGSLDRAATICSPPRRAWRASWPSPRGDVPTRHWFRLGRALTPVDRGSGARSGPGRCSRYLMPSLVMRAPTGA